MKEILTDLASGIVPLLLTALGGIAAYFGRMVQKLYEEKIKSETIDKVLKTTVEYVEQVFVDLKGKEKLDKACDLALARLRAKGIDLEETELVVLIEAFVRGLEK